MKTNYELVKEFHETFGHPVAERPNLVNTKMAKLRIDLIKEEFDEFQDAICDNDIIEIADAIGDILYVTYGAALVYGINADDVLEEIHRSNMTKLDADGKPIRREDGKILKGPNFQEPDIAGALGIDNVDLRERISKGIAKARFISDYGEEEWEERYAVQLGARCWTEADAALRILDDLGYELVKKDGTNKQQ